MVTWATTNILRRENKQRNHHLHDDKGSKPCWPTHDGKFKLPDEMPPPRWNKMCSSGLAVHWPAYKTLLENSTGGYNVKTCCNCSEGEIHAAVMRSRHESVMSDEAIAHFAAVLYNGVKGNLPRQMAVLPIAVIPHKSKAFSFHFGFSISHWDCQAGKFHQ